MQLVALEHPKVVNSAYFSPISGGKILRASTTGVAQTGLPNLACNPSKCRSLRQVQAQKSQSGNLISVLLSSSAAKG